MVEKVSPPLTGTGVAGRYLELKSDVLAEQLEHRVGEAGSLGLVSLVEAWLLTTPLFEDRGATPLSGAAVSQNKRGGASERHL